MGGGGGGGKTADWALVTLACAASSAVDRLRFSAGTGMHADSGREDARGHVRGQCRQIGQRRHFLVSAIARASAKPNEATFS